MNDDPIAKSWTQRGAPEARHLRGYPATFRVAGSVRPPSNGDLLLERSSRLSIVGLLLIGVVYALGNWSGFLTPVIAAIVFGLMLGPPMGLLERFGLSSALAALTVIILLAGSLYLGILYFAPPFTEWFVRLPELWQEIERHVSRLRFHLRTVEQVEEQLSAMGESGNGETERVAIEQPGFLRSVLSLAPPAIGQVILFFGALYFYLATRHGIREGLLSLSASRGAKLRTARILRDVESNISRYLLTIGMINIGLGICTGLAMWIIGMPSPALWGAVAAIMNFIPYVGPWAFIILLGAVGLVSFDTLSAALVAPSVFIVLNIVESQFVTPAVLGRRLMLNPFMIVVALGFWMWLWGPIGAFLALPLLIISVTALTHILPGSRARMRPEPRAPNG
jgi:predicted PurR-regulated permease PerM